MEESVKESNGNGWEDPIAIVGMGCRYPGDATSPSKLWDLLDAGRSALSTVPSNRFNVDAWYHPDSQRPGGVSAKGGYFISDDDSFFGFDPSFFGINPKEAATMDPQQRKLLEVVYECFESAGITLDQLSGSQTGCYVGCFTSDCKLIQNRDVDFAAPYQVTGGGLTIISNRINYVFNLKGPSVSIDTACSSSLYALHLACQALLSGDCSAAIVGGTNIILDIEQHMDTMRLGVLSPTSTCHTFDESADGFGRAEGIAAIYIKRLSNAMIDGDPIRAVIRATAVNTNGKGAGINHPSVQGQEECIRKAYSRAGLSFDKTGYFECHGTGTPVGDPIECEALGNVFASDRSADKPLLIGSIKTNLGHTEGASGLAGVMKVVLSFEKGRIPATIGIKRLNPNIDFKDGRLRVVRCNTPWPESLKYHRASVNSFGYGGANAHVILDAVESYLGGHPILLKALHDSEKVPPSRSGDLIKKTSHRELQQLQLKIKHEVKRNTKQYLFVFSAHDHATLLRNISAVSKDARTCDAFDLAYTLGVKRSRFLYGAFGISNKSAAPEQLQESKMTFGIKASSEPVLAFAFSGQGAQWPQMGYELIRHFPSVRKTFEELEASLNCLQDPPAWSLIEEISKPEKSSMVYESTYSPPLCTAIQIAVVQLLRSWGIRPVALVGHSSGEVAAAFCSGLLTASQAMAVAYYRGVSCAVCHQPGAMMAVGLGADKVKPFLTNKPDVVIACHNSPESVTLSGGIVAIDEIQKTLKEAGIFARKLNSSGNAYHSHLVKAAGQHYEDCFGGSSSHLAGSASKLSMVSMYSCIDGEVLQSDQVGIKYWRRNLESPVLFDKAVVMLLDSHPEVTHVVEIGVHSALAGPIKQIRSAMGMDAERLTYLPSLIRGGDGVENLLRLAGMLFIQGYPVSIDRINAVEVIDPSYPGKVKYEMGAHMFNLPTYQWNYGSVMWIECRWSRELRFRKHGRHDLLGSREPGSSLNEPLWRNRLSLQHVPWLQDHKIGNDIIFPAAGYMAMAIEAVTQVYKDCNASFEGYTFQNLRIASPLILPEEGDIEILFNLRVLHQSTSVETSKWFDFRVSSVTTKGKWTEHVEGLIAAEEIYIDQKPISTSVEGSRGAASKESSDRRWYSALSDIGVMFGPTFQTLSDIRTTPDKGEATAKIALHTTRGLMAQESRYIMHPSTLDGCLQLANIAASKGKIKNIDKAFLPVTIEQMTLWKRATKPVVMAPETLNIRCRGHHHGLRSVRGETEIFDDDGRVFLHMKATFASVEGGLSKQGVEKPRQPYLRLIWQPDVERIKGAEIRKLFGSGFDDLKDHTRFERLEELARLCVLDCGKRLPEFELGNQPQNVRHFAQWLRTERSRLLEGPMGNLSAFKYRERIETLISDLGVDMPEARILIELKGKLLEIVTDAPNSADLISEEQFEQIYELGYTRCTASQQLSKLMKLFTHKSPGLRILEVSARTGGATRVMLAALRGTSPQPNYREYTLASLSSTAVSIAQEKFKDFRNMQFRELDVERDPLSQGFEEGYYDFVIATDVLYRTEKVCSSLRHCRTLLKPGGKLAIMESTEDRLLDVFLFGIHSNSWQQKNAGRALSPFISKIEWNHLLRDAGFSGSDIVLKSSEEPISSATIIISTAIEPGVVTHQINNFPMPDVEKLLWLVYRHSPHPLLWDIEKAAAAKGFQTKSCSLSDSPAYIYKGSRVIMLAELEGPVLSRMTKIEISALQKLAKQAASAVWITNGGLLSGTNPELSLIFGFANVVMIEQPSFRLSTIDIDPNDTDYARSASLIIEQEIALRKDTDNQLDNHIIMHNGVPYICRYVLDDVENEHFSRQLQPMADRDGFRPGLSLAFRQVSDIESFFFRETPLRKAVLESRQVLLEPRLYSLSKIEALILKGQHDFASFSHECIATVSRVGPDVRTVGPGDNVICLARGKFESAFVTEEQLCEILYPGEDIFEVAGLLVPHSTAMHALVDIAKVKRGQTVLIHVTAEPICVAAISISRIYGAKVLVTFNSEEEKEFLRNNYEIPDSLLFPADAVSLITDLMSATDGKGIDVILAGPDVSHHASIWSCLARNGKFVLTGGAEVPDMGIFDMSVFSRGATFSSFDLLDMIGVDPMQTATLMREILKFHRDGQLWPLRAAEIFDIAELGSAVKMVSRGTCFGKVLLSCGQESIVPIQPAWNPLKFDPNATYFLVGCLGGLGRSLASWMTTRDARQFVFLSRSGTDKPEAAALVDELERSFEDMSIQIVRGDVSVRADVDRAISMARSPIRGVVQAAMFLEDCLFDTMSLDIFNAVIQPKVRGTINLHEALLTSPLDFFVMTSSIITAIGTSTQCNYSAANTFLDGMARHRHSLGLPATSIALGMITEVGHVSDHPEVAEALRKNGMHGIDEDEYLRMMELVCRPRNPSPPAWDWDDYATAHIITGLEPGRVSKIQGKTLWLEDNRLRHVKTYLNASSSEHEIHKPSTANATPISRILAETAAQSGAEGVKAAVQDLVLERFSQIVLVPKERLLALPGRPLAELGMDSMVATEVRTWAWRELRVDVPFLRLLEGGRTVGELVGWVQEGVDLGLIEGASKSPALLDYETGTINKK